MFNTDKYLSVTWQMGGRAFPILDCYGLVHEIRRDLGMQEWPAFEGVVQANGEMDRAVNRFSENVKPCEPCVGAVAACYSSGVVVHLAVIVMLDGQLHAAECNKKCNVTFLPLARFERRYVKVEYYQ
ncbi:MAG TPA: nitrite transporter [Buttiauxella sp.]|nr:nitrite transporter [Buttiauxella sp.]